MSATDLRTSARSTDQLLGELGEELERAFAQAPPRRDRRVQALAAGVALVALTAATAAILLPRHDTAPAPHPVNAVAGLIARGRSGRLAWGLAATRCAGTHRYTVSLVTKRGSAATGCVGSHRPPATLYDASSGVALVFGAAPPATARVEVTQTGGAQTAPRLVRARRVPGVVVYAGRIALAQAVTAMTAYAAGARLIEACNDEHCVVP